MLAGQLALIAGALFTGAALYVSACEQPARLHLEEARCSPSGNRPINAEPPCRRRWRSLAHCSASSRGGKHSDWRWLVGGAVILANWPFTFLVIMPTNNALLALDRTGGGPRSRDLIEKWGRLHAGRTALGVAATILFLAASLRS